jgi:recombination protein RecT
MARPQAGPPPVQTSAVARTNQAMTPETGKYEELVRAFDRDDRKAELLAMLGSADNVQRFLAVAFHAIATGNAGLLRQCTVTSLIQAVKDSAALGLEPTGLTGEAWILPYGEVATLIPGWKGYLKRIRNSGVVQDLDCQLVYMNDEFDLTLGTNPQITHIPILVGELDADGKAIKERGEYRGAYAWARMPSGTNVIEYMTTADIQYVARTFSQAVKQGRPGPWTTSWGEMARKTVIRRLAKRLPQSAVDLLLSLDARADALSDDNPEGGATLDVSAARSAALAALGQRGTVPSLSAGQAQAPGSTPVAGELLEEESKREAAAARQERQATSEPPPLDDDFPME